MVPENGGTKVGNSNLWVSAALLEVAQNNAAWVQTIKHDASGQQHCEAAHNDLHNDVASGGAKFCSDDVLHTCALGGLIDGGRHGANG